MTAPRFTRTPARSGCTGPTTAWACGRIKGQVAAVGVGFSPTLRRWDGDPQKAIGAWAILAIRKAIEDAGVNPADVDGLRARPEHHHRRLLAGGRAGPAGLPGRVREHVRPVRRADQAQPGVAGQEHARADRPEVHHRRVDLHVDGRGLGHRGRRPRHGPDRRRRQGLAQHPWPLRPARRRGAGHRVRPRQVRRPGGSRRCTAPRRTSSGTCTSTTRPTT